MSSPVTRPTLLARLRRPEDRQAWDEFVEIYTPVLFRFARARGLSPDDSADVAQEVMRSVYQSIDRFELRPGRAKFRAWLFTIARNQIAGQFRHAARRPQGDGRTTLMAMAEEISAEESDEARWEREYLRALYAWAAAAVEPTINPRIWDAFHRTAILDESPDEVAAALGMTRAAVNVAKCRCLQRLREKVLSAAGERWEQAMIEEARDAERNLVTEPGQRRSSP